MLRGTHNGQATAERERKLKLGRYVVTLSVENHETYPEEHERHCSRPRFNIAQAFNKAWPQRGEERRREDRMREEGLLGGSGHKTCARAKPISSLGHDVLRCQAARLP